VRSGRGHKPPKLAPRYPAIRAYVAERADTTIETLRSWLLATHQISASVELIWHTLSLLGLRLKKRMARPSARMNSQGVLVCINVSGPRA
jgi:hypothetical protein